MTSVSNLYAAKLYSEHPIAIWPLDDDVSYVSLITNTQRKFQASSPYPGWSISNGVANDSLPIPDEGSPLNSNIYAGISGTTPLINGTIIEAVSPDLFLFSSCNQELETFCIGMYVYQPSNYISEYEFGYEYYDNDTSSWIEVLSSVLATDRRGWIHLQDTFPIQEFDPDYCHIIFRAVVNTGGTTGDYNFVVNGITVGQWSENFVSKSLGAIKEAAPISSGLSNDVVPADQYGLLSDNAYYVVEDGNLLAKNAGIPMIFGSENVTRVYPSSDGTPSIIIPNKEMFTEDGRNKNFTFEFWLKIRPMTKKSRRIMGPLDTNDGIYVTEGFITLVINNKFISHNISQWYRPMIVHLVIKDENFSLFINGEQVGQLSVNRATMKISESNWIGLYSYEDIDMMEVDCLSIFPYAVPLQVARKRFVWGQGTDPIELVNDSFDAEEAVINFSNAKYTANKVYPDMERWDAGYYNNLIATTNSISVPQYSLPIINLGGRGVDEWYEDNNTVNNAEYPVNSHPRFFTFRPNKSTRTNLITNPSFETNTTGWFSAQSPGGISRSGTFFRTGLYSAETTMSSTTDSNIAYTTVTFPSAGTYIYSMYTYVPLGSPLAGRTINVSGESGTATITSQSTITLGTLTAGSWVRTVRSITCSSAGTLVMVHRISGTLSSAVGLKLYTDSVLCEFGTSVLPYFDGSYADPTAKAISKSWNGTPNASTSTMSYWTTEGTNWTEQCYLNFNSLTFLSSPLSAFYGIFEVEKEVLETRTLFRIVNTLSGKIFNINITGYDVTYEFDNEELPGTGFTVDNTHFVVGCHIPSLSEAFNFELSAFFGTPELLEMYVGGDGETTFEGKVYRLGFSDQLNYQKISTHFDSVTGIADYQDDELLEGHYASYTLSPFFRYETYFLDISVSSQWEEYFPLSSFASYITKRDGSTAYDLDYMQINFGYPSLIDIIAKTVDNPNWTYQELFDSYNDPIQKSYEILDNEILTGYADYAALASNTISEYEIDTTGSSLDAYATFQLLAEGADEPLDSFIYSKALTDSYTVYAEEENTNLYPYKAYNTKFSIIDGTIVYPPKKINFENVAMVIHFNIEQDGIISNPLKVRNLEITSRALNENSLTEIGTKTGLPIYPYVKTGIYYSGKAKNPVLIGKDNLPYLYLTENSGIKVLEDDAEKEYGVIVPINGGESSTYSLGAMQMFMKYDITHPVSTTQVISTMTHPDGVIEFTITPDETALRFYISARDQATKQPYENISFYQNGIRVISPYISKNEWNAIAIAFSQPIDLSNNSESFNLLHGCNFENITFFKSTGLNEFNVTIPKIWTDILYGGEEENPLNIVDWKYWYDENGVLTIPNKWKDIYVLEETTQFSTTPSEIYSTYCGTNIVVVDDNTGMSIVNDDFTMFADQTWLKVVDKPV